jgi:hypothetical protein
MQMELWLLQQNELPGFRPQDSDDDGEELARSYADSGWIAIMPIQQHRELVPELSSRGDTNLVGDA